MRSLMAVWSDTLLRRSWIRRTRVSRRRACASNRKIFVREVKKTGIPDVRADNALGLNGTKWQ